MQPAAMDQICEFLGSEQDYLMTPQVLLNAEPREQKTMRAFDGFIAERVIRGHVVARRIV